MKRMLRIAGVLVLPLFFTLAANAAFGQDLPPGPTTVHHSTLSGITMPGEFGV